MSIFLRNGIWWLYVTDPDGKRIRRSTRTTDEKAALEFHDKFKHELWRVNRIGDKPERFWDDACIRWLTEKADKKSIEKDKERIRNLGRLRGMRLSQLSRDFIMSTVNALTCGNSTKNRYLALVRSILNKCQGEWEWIDKAPKLTLFSEPKKRIRWLTQYEAQKLIAALPEYLGYVAEFALMTGLRRANIFDLSWSQIDLSRGVAWVYADQTKSGRPLGVPLNQRAIELIKMQTGKHPTLVFTRDGLPILAISNLTWKRALKKANIDDFRFHDLRHTWASWLVQSGVPLMDLKEMGGWESISMVQKYAHLAPEHLQRHADLICTFTPQQRKKTYLDA